MSETIQLSPGLVAAYKELLTNPKKNGFPSDNRMFQRNRNGNSKA